MREDWDAILGANVVGLYNLYEAARRHGVKRIVYASSNHATGFYGTDQVISPSDPVRPDTLYGLSKTWGENIARLYFDRYGIETACLRIGSAFAEPRDLRMLATWLSYDDLERLVHACLTAPRVGHTIIYGVSRNSRCFWDNTSAGHIGYAPQDSADDYRAVLEAKLPPLAPTDDGAVYQGGPFVRAGS
jgi:uronate dehydrogenase